MALNSIPRFDDDRLTGGSGRAVVVGASMAGLMAARVLADAFETVTVVDTDPVLDEPVGRRGTPQDRHVHVLQEAGRATLEDLFPGFGEALLSAGGLMVDSATDLQFYDEGDFIADGPTRLPMYCASRPLFEYVARELLADIGGVTLRGDCRVKDYLRSDDGTAVEGVVLEEGGREETTFPADLVVDATGRTSRTPSWLENHGYTSPSTDEVVIDLAYSTVVVDRPPDDRRGYIALPTPPRTRGGGVIPVENGGWLVTLAGVHGDHPPTDVDGLLDFAGRLPIPHILEVLEDHEIRSEEVHHYPFRSTVRHRYEDLDRFPDGLVVVGDAIASFNPVYGQGMSVAALEAVQLHHALAAGGTDSLPYRFFQRAGDIVDDAWNLAVSADFQYPETTGPRPLGTGLLSRYLSRLTRKAHTDPVLADAFARVLMMERRPMSLVRPAILWRVLKPTLRSDRR